MHRRRSDSQAQEWRISPVLEKEESQDRQAAQPWHFQDAATHHMQNGGMMSPHTNSASVASRLVATRARGLAAGLFVVAVALVRFTRARPSSVPLYSFSGGSDGSTPIAGLVQGTDGNFYGTTVGGGLSCGTVYKITSGGSLTTLYSFSCGGSDGSTPYAGLVQGSDGDFYGTTYFAGLVDGGNYGFGTVFKITSGGSLNTLYTFSDGNDGGNPIAGLVQGTDGDFY